MTTDTAKPQREHDHNWDMKKEQLKVWLTTITPETSTPLSPYTTPFSNRDNNVRFDQFNAWFIVNWQKAKLALDFEVAYYLACAFFRYHRAEGWYPRVTSLETDVMIEIMVETHGRIG